jgi:hypothetical protein
MFMVRDYGLGMTHQFIMGDFKSLFKSTKDHTNKVVGMKGLGSKSPFAYTDAFILRVFSGQTVRTYSTYLGEDGIPQLAYQGEGPSDERRGVAVQFPVQTKDIDDFYAAAIRVLKGFPVLPEGLPKTVTDGLSCSDSAAVEVGSFWKAYPKGWLGMGAFARQGCVIYPIDLDKIEDGAWLKTLDLSVIIEFPIGTVQMVDSREFLAYDEETVANINDACSRIKNDIDEKIKRVMSSARTIWDVRHLFKSDMFDGLGPLARGSRQYAAITALNTFMKECLPKRKSERGTAKQLFYSIVRLKKSATATSRTKCGSPTPATMTATARSRWTSRCSSTSARTRSSAATARSAPSSTCSSIRRSPAWSSSKTCRSTCIASLASRRSCGSPICRRRQSSRVALMCRTSGSAFRSSASRSSRSRRSMKKTSARPRPSTCSSTRDSPSW